MGIFTDSDDYALRMEVKKLTARAEYWSRLAFILGGISILCASITAFLLLWRYLA